MRELNENFVVYEADESEEEVCPVCSGQMDYDNFGLEDQRDDFLIRRFECPHCGAEGEIYRKIVFDGYVVHKKETQKPEEKDVTEFIVELEKIASMHDFKLHPYEENGILCGYEMEGWTPAGVNMLHFVDCRDVGVNPTTVYEELDKIWRCFEVDEQIDQHRQDKRYAQDFTIRQSLEDFEIYNRQLANFCKEAMEVLETYFRKEHRNG